MSEGYISIRQERCARVFQAAAQLAVVVAVMGLFWYGSSVRPPRAPEAYLSGRISETVRSKNLSAFVREINTLDFVDQMDVEGVTPLLAISASENSAAVEHLLARGANPNVCHAKMGTPLIRAIVMGHREIALLLLRYGADASLATFYGDTPALAAIRSDCFDLLPYLLTSHVPPASDPA